MNVTMELNDEEMEMLKNIVGERMMPTREIQHVSERANSIEAHHSSKSDDDELRSPILVKRRAMNEAEIEMSAREDCGIIRPFRIKAREAKKISDEEELNENVVVVGFERGLVAERIMEVMRKDDKIIYEMKWRGDDAHDWVYADEANVKCPDVVIDHFEKNINWVHNH